MNLDVIQVLLVDDDEDDFVNIKGIVSEIAKSKYKITWMSSYEDGLSALKKNTYDICLLDFRLGARNGLEFMSEAHGLGIVTPMIILTGFGDFETDIKAMQSGAADYLVKGQISAPLLERTLRYAIKHALDMSDLEAQKENFRTLFNSTFEGILVHKDGTIVDANTTVGEIFGCPPSTLIETQIAGLLRPDFREALKEVCASDRESEAIGVKRDGSEICVGLCSRSILLNGRKVGLMAIRDLSHQKELEAKVLQQDRLASLGLLASSLAHEIGTPLGVIRGRAQMIENKSTDETVKSTMTLITVQIDRVSKLVGSLLSLARGQTSEFAANIDAAKVISDVTDLMSHELQKKNIALRIEVPKDLYVLSEPGPLGQVFLNLLVNSVFAINEAQKMGRTEGHEVSVTAEVTADSTVFTVADTGCGISEANMRQLFKPFFTTKDIGVGTGLGLATSFKLVESWGGSISVESEVNEGTTFKILLKTGRTP